MEDGHRAFDGHANGESKRRDYARERELCEAGSNAGPRQWELAQTGSTLGAQTGSTHRIDAVREIRDRIDTGGAHQTP